jgi:DNA-binding FadR family transcriptional regulator
MIANSIAAVGQELTFRQLTHALLEGAWKAERAGVRSDYSGSGGLRDSRPQPGDENASALRDAILANLKSCNWRPGCRIPTEREFSAQFGLSRSTVRRVLADLKEKRLIRQTVGSGTYVSERVNQVLPEFTGGGPPPSSLAELMDARLTVEPAIAQMAARSATAQDFLHMDECCRRGETATSFEEVEHWNSMLHEAIAEAAHNTFISNVHRLVNEIRVHEEWRAMRRLRASAARRTCAEQEHRELIAALKSRDSSLAGGTCTSHLIHVRHHLLD